MNKYALAVLMLALAALTGCQNLVGLYREPKIEIFDRRLPETEIVTAIKDAASSQGWEVVEEGPGYVLVSNVPEASARYSRGANPSARPRFATVKISYTVEAITISYSSSERLSYSQVTEGKQAVNAKYNSMVTGLEQAIQFQVDKRVDILDIGAGLN